MKEDGSEEEVSEWLKKWLKVKCCWETEKEKEEREMERDERWFEKSMQVTTQVHSTDFKIFS